jgi:hypothetical protein
MRLKSRPFNCRVVFGLLLSASSLTFIATPQEPDQSNSAAAANFTPKYFFGQATLTTAYDPVAVVAGDFNEDGAMDVATVNMCGSDPSSCVYAGSGSVSILLRSPDGTFQQHVDYPVESLTIFTTVVTGDFNKDGHLDLAVNAWTGEVSILLGNGDGTFQNARVYATRPTYPEFNWTPGASLTAGDFNRDGKLDLAVLLPTGISLLLGNGDGTFAAHVDYALPPPVPNDNWAAIAAADFDGDGKLDLVATNMNGTETISVLRGNGDGTFQNPVYQQIQTEFYSGSIIVGDFNRDGKPDLAISFMGIPQDPPAPGAVLVLLGNGDGTFTPFYRATTGAAPGDIKSGDFNHDGKLDLAVTNEYETITILLGNGDGTFPTRTDYGTRFWPAAKAVGDFNGDGNLDLAVVALGSTIAQADNVLIVPGNGDGTFQSRADYSIGSSPSSVVLPDLNGDNKLDLAVTGSDNTVAILLGNGGGKFKSPVKYSTGMNPVSVRTADFNLDGKADLATVNSKDNTVSVLLGNGDGTVQPHMGYRTGTNPVALSARDLNGDGNPDLAVVNKNDNTVSVLIGKGDGTFLSQVTYPTSNGPDSIFVGDFNGDGALDLAIANFSSNTVSILLGNGDGSFKPHIDYATAAKPLAVIAADFNRDGKLDLAVATQAKVSVLLGNGDGTFRTHTDIAAGPNPTSLATRDFNGDGLPDLAVTNFRGVRTPGGVSILLNKGNGQFQPSVEFDMGQDEIGAVDVVAGDVDGDGSPDLVVANSLLSTVSVLRNPPVIGLYPGHLSFGKEVIGSSSGTRTVLLSNPSMAVLSLGKIAIAGANAADFSEINSCTAQMKGGTSCQVQVTFTPKASGARTAVLTITDNAGTKPQTVKLTGSGVK